MELFEIIKIAITIIGIATFPILSAILVVYLDENGYGLTGFLIAVITFTVAFGLGAYAGNFPNTFLDPPTGNQLIVGEFFFYVGIITITCSIAYVVIKEWIPYEFEVTKRGKLNG